MEKSNALKELHSVKLLIDAIERQLEFAKFDDSEVLEYNCATLALSSNAYKLMLKDINIKIANIIV